MVDALRLARERIGLPIVVPAVISWALLFGYQWAFYLTYHGSQPTVFSYMSGIIGDGVLIPTVNLGAFILLRQLWPNTRWQRLPLYVGLALLTTFACFLAQAGLGVVNWSMPSPYHWSPVGRFHFMVMWSEITYLYVAMSVAINNWSLLRSDGLAWRSFWVGWLALGLFGVSLVTDVVRFAAL
jgi:hypothetical protein